MDNDTESGSLLRREYPAPYIALTKFPKGFQRGKRRKGWILKKFVRFPFWPSGESENHTEGSRWLFAYFLANEKVWHPLTMTKPFIKMRHASGGCLSCSGKKDTKEPARGGTDREACRCRCVSLPCTPASSRPPRDPVGTLDVLLAAEAASSPIGPCHSLRSLALPQAALPSLPPPGPCRYLAACRF